MLFDAILLFWTPKHISLLGWVIHGADEAEQALIERLIKFTYWTFIYVIYNNENYLNITFLLKKNPPYWTRNILRPHITS